MLGRISLWTAGAVVAGLMLSPPPAMAQFDAHTRADLNLRVGPGVEYGVIDVIPAGYPVDVLGCLDEYEWCDIEWDGLRGWVSARYLVQPGTTVYLPQYAPRIGVPIISFSFGAYHDRYYRDRPWYRERHGRWRGREWRDRRDRGRDRDRAGQREERRDAEQPRRQRDAEQPRRQRDAEQPRRQRDAEQPRRQREVQPQQQRQREAQPQQQERQARPRLGEGTQQQDQRRQRRNSGEEEEQRQPRLGQ